MKYKILAIIGIFGIFLISGCVSDTDYENSQKALASVERNLLDCEAKECPECEECKVCEEDTTEETEEEVSEECPYDCESIDRVCAATMNDEGQLTRWQCV